jgi:SNF2 family DNA or RNA helicase
LGLFVKGNELDGTFVFRPRLHLTLVHQSNDFKTERKWKFASSKKLGKDIHRLIQRKELDKRKEFQLRVAQQKKLASKMGREVKKLFWDKVDRIVLFKTNADYFQQQQQLMDRNLERLLGQTERYTQSLIDKRSFDVEEEDVVSAWQKEKKRQALGLADRRQLMNKYTLFPQSSKSLPPVPKVVLEENETVPDEVVVSAKEEVDESSEEDNLHESLLSTEKNEDDESFSEASTSSEEDEESLLEAEREEGDCTLAEMEADAHLSLEELLAREYSQPVEQEEAATAAPLHQVPIPFLMSKDRVLREYQREGLDWLVSLYHRRLNGILADEMGSFALHTNLTLTPL